MTTILRNSGLIPSCLPNIAENPVPPASTSRFRPLSSSAFHLPGPEPPLFDPAQALLEKRFVNHGNHGTAKPLFNTVRRTKARPDTDPSTDPQPTRTREKRFPGARCRHRHERPVPRGPEHP